MEEGGVEEMDVKRQDYVRGIARFLVGNKTLGEQLLYNLLPWVCNYTLVTWRF